MMDLISGVICTYNRSRSLRDTLESLAAQQIDGFDYEVVVVDNNSRDDTRALVRSFEPAFGGRLRYIFEERQGLSYARNAGVEAARGVLIAFTDDDVKPEESWISQLYAAYRTFDADCVYGKVLPRWVGPRPAWLGPYFLKRLAMVDRGDEAFVVASSQDQFVGANFAVTKRLCERVGLFNVALGNRGDQIGGEEDTEFFERLLASGARIVYTPRAVVRHTVQPERVSARYFRRWHFQHGVSAARIGTGKPCRMILGVPFWAIRKGLGEAAGYIRSLGSRDSERRLAHQMRIVYYLGLCAERTRLYFRRSLPCGRS